LVLTLEWGEEVKDPHEKDKKPKKEEASKPGETKEGEAKPPDAQTKPEDKPKPEEKPKAEDKPKGEDKPKAEEKKDEKADDKKWEYEEPLGVREDKRRKWEEGRDCAIKLHQAGVEFSFGSGSSSADETLKKVRTLVEKGLPPDAALAALTTNAAKLVGFDAHLGTLRAGADATLALWTANPLTKDAKCGWLFVDGFANEFEIKPDTKAEGKPAEGVDVTGKWSIETKTDQGTRAGTLELTMTPEGDVTGTLTTTGQGGNEQTVEYKGHVGGKTMTLEGSYTRREIEITSKWKVELAGDSFEGTSTTKGPWGEAEGSVKGTRAPKRLENELDREEADDDPR
jgi:hypothetical protein